MILDSFLPVTFKRQAVPVDEIQKGGEILVTEMDAEKSMRFNEMVVDQNKDPEAKSRFVYFMAAMCAATMVRENGELLVDPKHYRELPKQIPFAALTRIYDAAAALNGFTPELRDKAKKP